MKLLPAVLLLILLLALSAPAATAAGISAPALQPVRTIIPVVTTTTVPDTPAIILRTTSPTLIPVTIHCAAPASCMAEQDAAALWGRNNYTRDSDQPCSSGTTVSRVSSAPMYCYLQKDSIVLTRTTPLATTATISPAVTNTITQPLPVETGVKDMQTLQAPESRETKTVPPVTIVTAPVVTTPAPVSAKPASIVDMVIGFFASIFGGQKNTGSSSSSPGGDMEPTPSLPGGMKPVTQVTTHAAGQPMDTSITVTSPVAGALYSTGDVIPVKWNKPQNPAGTVTLNLVSQEGSTQTTWATAFVPNTGDFSWYQQDLAHDCGLQGNADCFGPNLTEMGITQTIQYQNAHYLAPDRTFRIEISTDAMDPYPAFYGQSGTFTIRNPSAYFDTTLQQDRYIRLGSGIPQKLLEPVTEGMLPWTGYRHSTYGGTQQIEHEIWRTVIKPDLTGLYTNDKVKKATLTLQVKTDKGTGEGISAGTADVKTDQAIAQAWALDGKYTSFAAKSQLPVIASFTVPTTPGSSGDAVYDAAAGTITLDLTVVVNQWLTKVSERSIVLVGPDENDLSSPQFFYSQIEVRSFTIERA